MPVKFMPPKLALAIAAADKRDAAARSTRLTRAAFEARRRGRGLSVMACVIEGAPVAWARARTGKANAAGRRVFYTQAEQAAHKRHIHQAAALAMRGRPPDPGAIELTVMVWLPIPATWPAWKREAAAAGDLRPTAKPDADNFAKLVKDALTGVAWVDDAQVVDLCARKFFTTGAPCTNITVRTA